MSKEPSLYKLWSIVSTEGIWVLISYRLGRWVRYELYIPIVKQILMAFTLVLHAVLRIITKIDIPFDVEIGRGFYIGHCGYIVVNSHAKLGSYCNISPGVIIGEGGRGECRGVPKIGDRVYIGPGAKIFGPILIGDNVAVGANAVVCDDVPDDAVVGGVPAKILSYNGSKDFVVTRE